MVEVVRVHHPRVLQRLLLPDQALGWLGAVEGPIGVGKTTLARRLERDLAPAYLTRLAGAYEEFFATFDQALVITVDTDRLDLRDEVGVAVIADVITAAGQGKPADDSATPLPDSGQPA